MMPQSQLRKIPRLRSAPLGMTILALLISGCGLQPVVHSNDIIPLLSTQGISTTTRPVAEVIGTSDKSVGIVFFGDIMLDRNVKKQIDAHGFDYLLEDIANDDAGPWKTADAIIANLEGPFANYRRPTTKSIAFQFDHALIPYLIKYRLVTLSQANNHTLDMGRVGFKESKENLKSAAIDAFGAEYEVDKNSLLYKDVKDLRIALLGVNDTHTHVTITQLKPLIDEARQNADVVIVFIHWGEEYKPLSNTHQRTLAHQMIDTGADIIVGAHPHVVQEVEMYNHKPIFYSLGNFIFDQYFSVATQQGLGVALNFTDKKLVSFQLLPVQSEQSRLTWMTSAAKEKFLEDLFKRSRLDGMSTSTDTVYLQ